MDYSIAKIIEAFTAFTKVILNKSPYKCGYCKKKTLVCSGSNKFERHWVCTNKDCIYHDRWQTQYWSEVKGDWSRLEP